MKLTTATLGMALAGVMALAVPAIATAGDLTPEQAAGKVIFEETAGGVGCASCHGMDASGDIGPAIAGQTADNIKMQFSINENMMFIELTDEEVAQVAAYLDTL